MNKLAVFVCLLLVSVVIVFAQSKETRIKRLETLYALCNKAELAVIVTTLEALSQSLMDPREFIKGFRMLKVGDRVSLTELLTWLIELGYERVERVERVGLAELAAASVAVVAAVVVAAIRFSLRMWGRTSRCPL